MFHFLKIQYLYGFCERIFCIIVREARYIRINDCLSGFTIGLKSHSFPYGLFGDNYLYFRLFDRISLDRPSIFSPYMWVDTEHSNILEDFWKSSFLTFEIHELTDSSRTTIYFGIFSKQLDRSILSPFCGKSLCYNDRFPFLS